MKYIRKTDEYDAWAKSIKDKTVSGRIQVRIERLLEGNTDDVAPVGDGVSELRLHFGVGWRIYFTEQNDVLIILLAGGSKSTQSKDIKLAIKLSKNL
jgi:putative addiction module killer protein